MKRITIKELAVSVADTYLTRLFGLLKEQKPDEESGLLITPCRQVHTFGMRFPIDVIYLSRGSVVRIERALRPGRISPYVKKADSVLELAAGVSLKKEIMLGEVLIGGTENVSNP